VIWGWGNVRGIKEAENVDNFVDKWQYKVDNFEEN